MHKRALSAALLALLISTASWAGEWSLKDKDGKQFSLANLKGKWVLVNFWAPWCPSCLQEIPDLTSIQNKHPDIQVIGVAVMYRTRKEILDIAQSQSIAYPIVLGNEDIASEFGGMSGMPTSFLYSPSGKLVGHHEGPLTQPEIEQAMNGKPAAFTQ